MAWWRTVQVGLICGALSVGCDSPVACGLDCVEQPGCHHENAGPCTCGTLVCPAGDGGTDGGTDGGAEGGIVACGRGTASTFPVFDRRCAADTECFVALHQTDCCGSARALGLNVAQRANFTAAEVTCDAMYPACQCASGPPVTDDGMNPMPGARIVAHCLAGTCSTTAR